MTPQWTGAGVPRTAETPQQWEHGALHLEYDGEGNLDNSLWQLIGGHWELVPDGPHGPEADLRQFIYELGLLGWEMCAVAGRTSMYFKRPLPR